MAGWYEKLETLQVFGDYLADNNKIRKVMQFFGNYPEVITVERSRMGNPAYVIYRLVESMRSLPTNYTKARERDALRDRALAGMLFWMGMRETEATLIRRQDIDLIGKTANIPTLKQKKGNGKVLYRPIPLDHVPAKELKLWAHYFEVFDVKGQDRVFPIANRTVNYRVHKLMDLHPHALRHALGLLLYEVTKDIRQVAQVLRHTNIANTLIYTRLSMDSLRDALKALQGSGN